MIRRTCLRNSSPAQSLPYAAVGVFLRGFVKNEVHVPSVPMARNNFLKDRTRTEIVWI